MNQYVFNEEGVNYFLDGYWQNEEFLDFQAIRSDVNFVKDSNYLFLYDFLYHRITTSTSVAVHVRRLDYNVKLDLEYYENAMKQMHAELPDCTFFVFSDDIEWCQNNLNGWPSTEWVSDIHTKDDLAD